MSGTYPATPEATSVTLTSVQPNLMSETRSGRRQVRSIGSQRWALTLSYNPMTRAEFMPIYAFVLSQKGQYDTFTIAPPVISSSSGNPTGTVTTNGSSSAGAASVTLAGLSGSLKAGDLIKFANHTKVYMLTADRSGAGSVGIEPPLLTTVGTGVAVTYNAVPITVRLNNDLQQYKLSGYERYGFEVDMVEVL